MTSGPVIEKAGDLAGLLTNLEEGDILFIDEIHRIPKTVEEYLYSAMEDFRLDIMIDQGPNARSVRLSIPQVHPRRRHDPQRPAHRAAALPLHAPDPAGLLRRRHPARASCGAAAACSGSRSTRRGEREIAARARGTPRVANNLIHFVRDFAQERGGRA